MISMKLLKKNWKRLHSLIYISTAAGIIHYFWLVKSDYRLPALYAAVFFILMLFRAAPLIKKNK